jgi:hypothetical protein
MWVEHYFRVENGWELKVLPTPEHTLDLEYLRTVSGFAMSEVVFCDSS